MSALTTLFAETVTLLFETRKGIPSQDGKFDPIPNLFKALGNVKEISKLLGIPSSGVVEVGPTSNTVGERVWLAAKYIQSLEYDHHMLNDSAVSARIGIIECHLNYAISILK